MKTFIIALLLFMLVGTIWMMTNPQASARPPQPAQIEEIAHTNTLAVYRVQDGGCTIYIAQGVQGIGPTGTATITVGYGCGR